VGAASKNSSFTHNKGVSGDYTRSIAQVLIFRFDGACGACVGAGAAIGADFRIDDVVWVSLADRAYGTFGKTHAASYASVHYFICHSTPPFFDGYIDSEINLSALIVKLFFASAVDFLI
jgi:hypothetical protein